MSIHSSRKMSVAAFARFMHVSRAAVRKAVASGRVTPNADGTLDGARCRREWRERTRERIDGPFTDPRIRAARLVRETVAARMAELRYRIRTGELVSKTQVRIEAFERARRGRDLLKNLGSRVGPIVSALSDPAECTQVIDAEVARVVAEIEPPAQACEGSPENVAKSAQMR